VKKHYVLWTGGMDSSFRMCQLACRDVEVQPVYLVLRKRDNVCNETNARRKMLQLLRRRRDTRAILHDPLEIRLEDLPDNPELEDVYRRYENRMGTQFEYLGTLGKMFPDPELCIKKPSPGQVSRIQKFLRENNVRIGLFPDGSFGKVDREHCTRDGLVMMGLFSYPIMDTNGPEANAIIHANGWEYILKHSWSCEGNGRDQCGICHQCALRWLFGWDWSFDRIPRRNHEIVLMLEGLENDFPALRHLGVPNHFRRYMWRKLHVRYTCGNEQVNVLSAPRYVRFDSLFDFLLESWDALKKDYYGARCEILRRIRAEMDLPEWMPVGLGM